MRTLISKILERFRTCEPWAVTLSLSIALTSVMFRLAALFYQIEPLSEFRDRAIGMTTLEAIDASGYAHNYVRLHVLFVVVAVACYVLLTWLGGLLDRRLDPASSRGLKRAVTILGEVAIVVVVLRLLVHDDVLDTVLIGLYYLIDLVVVVAVVRAWSTWPTVSALAADGALLTGSLLLPLPAYFLYWLAADRPLGFAWDTPAVPLRHAGLAAVILAAAAGIRAVLERRARDGAPAFDVLGPRLLWAGVPWLLIPVALPIANELQYRWPATDPRSIAWILIGVLLAATVAAGLLPVPRFFRDRTDRLVHALYYPIFLLTMAVFRLHRHTMEIPQLDYFHQGETTLPTQQWFSFSSVPLIDLRLTHTFSDMFYQSWYTLLNGLHGIDMLIWKKWMPEVAAILLIYFVLARLASPLFAVLAAACVPVLGLATSYYAPALLPALAVSLALRRPTFGRCLFLWVSAFGLLLWRFDFGLAGLVALVPILTVDALRADDRRWKTLLTTFGIAAGGLAAGVATLALLGHRPALDSLGFLLASYSDRLVTRTRSAIIFQFDAPAIFQYYLLPVLSWVPILYFALRRAVAGHAFAARKYLLVYLGAFSLILSVRSLERHSLTEGFNPYLFSLLLVTLPFLWVRDEPGGRQRGARLLFFVLTIVYMVLALPPHGRTGAGLAAPHLFKEGPLFEMHEWTKDEPRVLHDGRRHGPLIDFFDHQLGPDQTFYDFTNSPMLYVFADRRFPTYVIPNLIQTSETVQRRVLGELEELRSAGRLPYVVFKQGDPFWDATDGVPNEIRCYRVTEYVYRHYEPAFDINGYQVWKEKGLDTSSLFEHDVTHAVGLRPDFLAQSLRVEAGDGTVRLAPTGGPDPNVARLFDLSALPDLGGSPWRLHLSYRASAAGELQVFFSSDGAKFREAASERVMIAPSPGGAWQEIAIAVEDGGGRRLTDVRLDPPPSSVVEIRDWSLVRGHRDVTPLRAGQITQSFDLQYLPRVWGELDPLDAAHTSPVVASLIDAPVVLEPDEPLSLRVPADLDRSAGQYLHLRLAYPHGRRNHLPVVNQDFEIHLAYGRPFESTFELDLDLDRDLGARFAPGLHAEPPVRHDLDVQIHDDRLVLTPAGHDPWIHRFLDLEDIPVLEDGAELFVVLRYRSSSAGLMQVYFSFDGRHFSDDDVTGFELAATTDGYAEEVLVAVPVPSGARRLCDLRLDPPIGAVVEIEKLELAAIGATAHDYLLRLSSQWAWVAGDVDEIRITAPHPVAIEGATLRQAD